MCVTAMRCSGTWALRLFVSPRITRSWNRLWGDMKTRAPSMSSTRLKKSGSPFGPSVGRWSMSSAVHPQGGGDGQYSSALVTSCMLGTSPSPCVSIREISVTIPLSLSILRHPRAWRTPTSPFGQVRGHGRLPVMSYEAADDRYDQISYRRTGRRGLKLFVFLFV